MVKSGLEVHPGEFLLELLDELDLSASALAAEIGVPANRISAIIGGSRGITADTALRLARFFTQPPEYWMDLQRTYDLIVAERQIAGELQRIRPVSR
jgi:addiction module HigA family antidote